ETAYQYGESRASFQPSDMTDLDNRAWFVHTELEQALLGRFDASLIFRFDYATGDSNPSDGEFNTFDSLFGDRSWEFGPTGIYGALHRMNLVSPGIALRMNPMQDVDVRLDYRAAWLESDRDYLITAAVRDPDGNSGSFVGHQLDGRWNWQAVPGNLAIAVGVAYLWKGEFLKTAPTAPPSDDTAYAYVATTLTF
ncbi:MAG: alginate export family protein, partial [Gammaproteobacteria bacterium]|nr:alginate export family protein [Gammaproteobacteria bacterium]